MTTHAETVRLRLGLEIRGAVQGVGFRPFVYRLAAELAVGGWVGNDTAGVRIEVEGDEAAVERFVERLRRELPPPGSIGGVRRQRLEPRGEQSFRIRESERRGTLTALVLPDLATCEQCRAEVLDPSNRRHGYAFTNCTACGPRFSIVRALPYDRPNTTMAGFTLCPECAREYTDPHDRRFHAQPNACPECGPRLALWDAEGRTIETESDGAALRVATRALRQGRVLAVKGLGGFHLMVAADDEPAVARLRDRKRRPAKPLALMAASIAQVRALCVVSATEARLLRSAESPIVLLARRPDAPVATNVAPGHPRLGVMLPTTPLHHLLLAELGAPVVATSGNLSEEPICTDEHEAVERLGGIADLFLVHDRPIERHVDDSVAWELDGAPRLLRRARGYAPLPVRLAAEVPPVLGVGAFLKNTVALGVGDQVFVSQHIGDLGAPQAQAAFERVIEDFLRLYEVRPLGVAHDLHPDYPCTVWAQTCAELPAGCVRIGVQHHHAHLAACLAENVVEGEALGVIWDGTGYGAVEGLGDGTVWGGEFLAGDAAGFERFAHLRPFRLPGGEAAVREPRRVAIALLWELLGEAALERDQLAPVRAFRLRERRMLGGMLAHDTHCATTTSMGRLFDGVASLLGLRHRVEFEGDAAMALEFVADPTETEAYSLPLMPGPLPGHPLQLDWRPTLEEMLFDLARGAADARIAARFHNALVRAAVEVAGTAGQDRVALSGGCFQNRRLAERTASALRAGGFEVLTHRLVPANDGGISLGQVAVAAAKLQQTGKRKEEGGRR